MKIKPSFLIIALLTIVFLSCSDDTKLIYPPEDVVNRVTDFYFMKDGKTIIYLNSNMNRKYDFGRIVIMEIDEDSDLSFIDSIIVPSLAGKMAVNSEENMIYVTSRDLHGIVRVKISGKSGSYRLSYIDNTNGDIPEILKTQKEPYAVILSEDEEKLFVTHLLNGEFSIVDLKKWELVESHKLKYGVTDITFDKNSGYYLTSHKSTGKISLIEPSESLSGFNVGITETAIDIPTDGYDIRSLKSSTDGESFYASFQNYPEDDEDASPQLLKFKLAGKKSTETELISTLSLKGTMGEISVLPYVTGSGENEYRGELIFIASPSQKEIYIVDSSRNDIIEQIKFSDKCEPYQVRSVSVADTVGYLLVSCFAQDKVYLYEIDLGFEEEELFKELGVIE